MWYLLSVALVMAVTPGMGHNDALATPAPPQSVGTVSGTFDLFLDRRTAIGMYVRFELEERAESGAVATISKSDFTRISGHPTLFSITYPRNRIEQKNSYWLVTTVAEDREGARQIATTSSPVLTQGHPSTVHVVIQETPEPVE